MYVVKSARDARTIRVVSTEQISAPMPSTNRGSCSRCLSTPTFASASTSVVSASQIAAPVPSPRRVRRTPRSTYRSESATALENYKSACCARAARAGSLPRMLSVSSLRKASAEARASLLKGSGPASSPNRMEVEEDQVIFVDVNIDELDVRLDLVVLRDGRHVDVLPGRRRRPMRTLRSHRHGPREAQTELRLK